MRSAGEEMNRGIVRYVVLAVGEPTGWIADRLPLADAASSLTSGLSSDEDLGSGPSVFAGGGRQRGGRAPRHARRLRSRRARREARAAGAAEDAAGDRRLAQPAARRRARPRPRRSRRRARRPRRAAGHRHLEVGPARLGQALGRADAQGPPGGRRDVPRRERGLPDRGRRQGGGVLRRRVGGAVRVPRALDDEHVPPQRRGAGLLAHCCRSRATPRGRRSRVP